MEKPKLKCWLFTDSQTGISYRAYSNDRMCLMVVL